MGIPKMIVIVVGIHGCGTRFVSQCLHESGVTMWEEKTESDHYEDKEILRLNMEELARHGYTWSSRVSGVIPPSETLMNGLKRYRQQRESKCEVYGFKEPRIALLLEAYRQVWPEAKWICCIRNPLRAAQSHTRNGRLKTIAQGLSTYADNLLKIAALPQVHYFNYDGDMNQQQQRLSHFLGIPVDLTSKWRK